MTEAPAPARSGYGTLTLIIVFAVGLLGGAAGLAAARHAFGPGPYGWGFHRFMHERMHDGMNDRMQGAGFTDEDVADRASRMVARFARRIDATEEQQKKLSAIAEGLAKEALPLRQKMFAARQRAVALLAQPRTDRAALETLRAEQVATADELSRKVAQALADAADVLTPEQRARLAKRWDF